MIHSHNTSEHERIMDAALAIKAGVDDLYVNHHNGNQSLNKRIKVLNERASILIERLESHVENTKPLDDIFEEHQKMKKQKNWILAAIGTIAVGVTTSLLAHYFKLL